MNKKELREELKEELRKELIEEQRERSLRRENFLRISWEEILRKVPKKIKGKVSWHAKVKEKNPYLNYVMNEDIEGPVQFQMPAPDSRRGIIFTIGTMKIAIFERYTNFKDSILVCHHGQTKDFDSSDYRQLELEDMIESIFCSALDDLALSIVSKVLGSKEYRLKFFPKKAAPKVSTFQKIMIRGNNFRR